MTDFAALLRCLSDAGVEYILVGGAAATAHGSARLTQDLDVVYRRSADNIHRLVSALAARQPYLRGAPPGLPFRWDVGTVRHGLNFTLATDVGAIDLLGEITGGGPYEELLPDCVTIKVFGVACQCLGLERLIQVKRAAGPPGISRRSPSWKRSWRSGPGAASPDARGAQRRFRERTTSAIRRMCSGVEPQQEPTMLQPASRSAGYSRAISAGPSS